MAKKIVYLFASVFFLTALTYDEIKLPKAFKNDFKFIPSGLVKMNADTLSVQSFYMLDHEVTNSEYQEFLNTITDEKIKEESQVIEINWRNEFIQTNFDSYYFSHPAYADYPVVNVTYEGAINYCNWLEERINTAFEGKRKVKVRLPFHTELIRAAVGDDYYMSYSWKGNSLRNSEGEFLCNFLSVPQERLTQDSNGSLVIKKEIPYSFAEIKGDDILAPSKSYFPSEFGVHNLNGNVAEMTIEKGIAIGGSWQSYGYDVRIQSKMTYTDASARVGFRPVFTLTN